MNRQAIFIAGLYDIEQAKKCAHGRLKAVLDKKDKWGISNDDNIGWATGELAECKLGDWIFKYDKENDTFSFNDEIPFSSQEFRDTICIWEGFYPLDSKSLHGIKPNGEGCIFVDEDEFLSDIAIAKIISKMETTLNKLTIYYFRSADMVGGSSVPSNIILKRIPFDLGVWNR